MVARIGYRSIVAAVLLGLVAALLLALLPRSHEPVVVRAGDVGALIAEGETHTIRSFYGFNQVENSGTTRFRWTDGLGSWAPGTVARPYALEAARPVKRGAELILTVQYHPSGRVEALDRLVDCAITGSPQGARARSRAPE